MMDFPTIHTNFWDAVIAIPTIMLLTQLLKIFLHIKSVFVPTLALAIGLMISVFISHRHDLLAGIFMGFFYGYAAIGNFSSLKTTIIAYKKRKHKKSSLYN